MTKALHNFYLVQCYVLESIVCQMVYFRVTLLNTIKHTFPTLKSNQTYTRKIKY